MAIPAIAAARPGSEHARGTWFSPARGPIDLAEVLEHAGKMSAVLLGETHDRAEVHRWQLQVATALHARGRKLALGFEMFPRRLQPALDRWVAGGLDTEAFLVESEWFDVWGFDPELYLPLFQFCRQLRVPMLALNCYRALVTRVRQEGWAAIPEAERDGLSPAAPATAAYRRYLLGLMSTPGGPPRVDDAKFDGFVAAQQTWDRAFAENIAKALRVPDPPLVVGIIGRGQLEFGHGTPHQLRDLGVEKIAVLLTRRGSDPDERALAHGIADAVFAIEDDEPAPPLPPRLGFTAEADTEGLRVASVSAAGPAAFAGLLPGDRIAKIAGRPVIAKPDLWAVLRRLVPGAQVPVELVRGQARLDAVLAVPLTPAPRAVRPGERPPWPG